MSSIPSLSSNDLQALGRFADLLNDNAAYIRLEFAALAKYGPASEVKITLSEAVYCVRRCVNPPAGSSPTDIVTAAPVIKLLAELLISTGGAPDDFLPNAQLLDRLNNVYYARLRQQGELRERHVLRQ